MMNTITTTTTTTTKHIITTTIAIITTITTLGRGVAIGCGADVITLVDTCDDGGSGGCDRGGGDDDGGDDDNDGDGGGGVCRCGCWCGDDDGSGDGGGVNAVDDGGGASLGSGAPLIAANSTTENQAVSHASDIVHGATLAATLAATEIIH